MDRIRSPYMVLKVVILMLFTVLISGLAVRSLALSKLLKVKRKKLAVTEKMDETSEKIRLLINEELMDISTEEYDAILTQIEKGQSSYTNEEALEEFHKRYEERINERFGKDSIKGTISGYLSGLGKEDDEVRHITLSSSPYLKLEYGEDGYLSDSRIMDLSMEYFSGKDTIAARDYALKLISPNGRFYSGNKELFSFTLIAEKGIYFTGKTSSVIGNIYAGSHSREERRDAEIIYGEAGAFGGLNINSTQLVFNSERIISDGDINCRNSFVIFGREDEPVKLYGKSLNEPDKFKLDNTVTIYGEFVENTDKKTEAIKKRLKEDISGLKELYDYYDSDNDKDYKGPYRKLLSNYDVTLSEDFTGVLITTGNVIIEEDVNVEGSIISLDRIYVQGNNNIVANNDIVVDLIEYEASEDRGEEANPLDIFSVSHLLKDYIDNIQYKGLVF
ncbi:MAG: hypothetical protein K5931_08930 [Lachnospiraceae bacterium]|nr:hypothetical protein [Lachnospiraceae bacterium]